MIDMIKPADQEYLVSEDFLQPKCSQVSGALFDALFSLNKYLMFEQRDPFVERQKREDEFETDWDRFACIDYNRLAMEEEAREEEAMEVDWMTVDDDNDGEEEFSGMTAALGGAGSSEAPFKGGGRMRPFQCRSVLFLVILNTVGLAVAHNRCYWVFPLVVDNWIPQ
jgi:hypothetical protein